MTPNPRVHNGWTWTGMTVNSLWRFRKTSAGKTTTVDIAQSNAAGAIAAALDQRDAAIAAAAPGVTK
jgi:hypothetical protein